MRNTRAGRFPENASADERPEPWLMGAREAIRRRGRESASRVTGWTFREVLALRARALRHGLPFGPSEFRRVTDILNRAFVTGIREGLDDELAEVIGADSTLTPAPAGE